MKLDFYYWSFQCPLNNEMIKLLKEYEGQLDISYHDISKNPELAEEMNMFFPTLTVINNRYRYFSPIRKGFLDSLCSGEIPIEKPYKPQIGTKEKNILIKPIVKETFLIASQCTGKKCIENCDKKIEFLKSKDFVLYGYINIDSSNRLLGGVEYMPSLLVPYKIPKDDKTVFLTCVYLSDNNFDYKSGPLKELENYLKLTYNKVVVVSDESGVFPNGDLKFFINNGYEDMGIISRENDYCTLHLLCKQLS